MVTRAGEAAREAGQAAREAVATAKVYNDALVTTICDFAGRHGWTIVLIFVIWYNTHDAIKRRWTKWQNDRSLAHANRPERRSVLDRERMRAVAAKQEEALAAARAESESAGAAAAQAQGKPQVLRINATFKKDM